MKHPSAKRSLRQQILQRNPLKTAADERFKRSENRVGQNGFGIQAQIQRRASAKGGEKQRAIGFRVGYSRVPEADGGTAEKIARSHA